MSDTSPRETASAEAARTNSELSQKLFQTSYPELQAMIGRISDDSNGTGIPKSVSTTFSGLRTDLNNNYDQAIRSSGSSLEQQAKQSGGIFEAGQVNDAQMAAALSLNKDRDMGMRNLKFQEAQAGMQQYNQLIQMLGGGSRSALQLGQGFAGNEVTAISNFSNQSQLGSTLGGASTGASAGSSFGPWGTAIGAVAGGAAGYMSSP